MTEKQRTSFDAAVEFLATKKKAIAAIVAPGVTLLGTAILPGTDGGSAITGAEWAQIGSAMLVSGVATYLAPKNRER